MLPAEAVSMDTSRVTIGFFAFSALDILDKLPDDKTTFIDWIYSMQVRVGHHIFFMFASAAVISVPFLVLSLTPSLTLF